MVLIGLTGDCQIPSRIGRSVYREWRLVSNGGIPLPLVIRVTVHIVRYLHRMGDGMDQGLYKEWHSRGKNLVKIMYRNQCNHVNEITERRKEGGKETVDVETKVKVGI